ncbi:hypothetical protein NC651_028435 [Populus alba x Populus x berolinensis]|nr:hypothetical protein NC651_028435 [Populus alba x Populus x berolinensis]
MLASSGYKSQRMYCTKEGERREERRRSHHCEPTRATPSPRSQCKKEERREKKNETGGTREEKEEQRREHTGNSGNIKEGRTRI